MFVLPAPLQHIPSIYLYGAAIISVAIIPALIGLHYQKKLHPEQFSGATNQHLLRQVIILLITAFICFVIKVQIFGDGTHRSYALGQYVAETVDNRPHESSVSRDKIEQNTDAEESSWRALETYRVELNGVGSLTVSHECDQLAQTGPCIGVNRLVLKDAARNTHVLMTTTVSDSRYFVTLHHIRVLGSKLMIPYGIDPCTEQGVPCKDFKEADVSQVIPVYLYDVATQELKPLLHAPVGAFVINNHAAYWNQSLTKVFLIPVACRMKEICFENPAVYDLNRDELKIVPSATFSALVTSSPKIESLWSDDLVIGKADFWGIDRWIDDTKHWTDDNHFPINVYHLVNPHVSPNQFVDVQKRALALSL